MSGYGTKIPKSLEIQTIPKSLEICLAIPKILEICLSIPNLFVNS